jgi:hypothetical protein
VICGVLLTEGLALFRPLTGEADQADVLTVCGKACAKSELIRTTLPEYTSRSLQAIISQVEETIAAEVTPS